MRQWTKHDARSGQVAEADQFNAQHQSARSQFTGFDRSQYPETSVESGQIVPSALHQCWIFSPWDAGIATALGEQTLKRASDASTPSDQFRAVNYNNHSSGWLTAFEATLSPFKGGNLLVEWYGCCVIQQFWGWTANAAWIPTKTKGAPNQKYVGLRILVNGVTLVERIGPAKPMDHFSITGAAQVPSGPATLTLQWNPTGAGPDDAVNEIGGRALNQSHLFANRVFAIGRWR